MTNLLALAVVAVPALAGEADVVDARVTPAGDGRYDFAVTVRHADSGWDHYADRWEVTTPDGEVIGTRVLHHPHVDEQPFTRSLADVGVPAGIERVRIRARDSLHGYGGLEVVLELP